VLTTNSPRSRRGFWLQRPVDFVMDYDQRHRLQLRPETFAICRMAPSTPLPEWAQDSTGLLSLTRTDEELSIICVDTDAPADVQCKRGYRVLKVEGPLPFEAIGVLADLTRPLAEADISIFAVSTYDTDYLFVHASDLARAMLVLRAVGYDIDEPPQP
jgi:hypothetical protein